MWKQPTICIRKSRLSLTTFLPNITQTWHVTDIVCSDAMHDVAWLFLQSTKTEVMPKPQESFHTFFLPITLSLFVLLCWHLESINQSTTHCPGWPRSSEIGSPPALESHKCNFRFLFLIHFLQCFSVFHCCLYCPALLAHSFSLFPQPSSTYAITCSGNMSACTCRLHSHIVTCTVLHKNKSKRSNDSYSPYLQMDDT